MAKPKFRFDPQVYTPEGAKSRTHAEIQSEYSRLRSIARKRLERFEGTEWTGTQVYKQYKGKFKPVAEIKSDRELRHLLSDVARYLRQETGSVSGLKRQRKLAIKTYHEHGYSFINAKNYKKFTDFMEFARIKNAGRLPGSDQIVEFFENNERQYRSSRELLKAYNRWEEEQANQHRTQHKEYKSSQLYRQEYKRRKK